MSVTVPPEFARLGFSGLFHTVILFHDEAQRAEYRGRTPCLMKERGWMMLEVNDAGEGVLVRTDAAAVVDIFRGDRG